MSVRVVAEDHEYLEQASNFAGAAAAQDQESLRGLLAGFSHTPPPAPERERVVVKRALPDREILAMMNGLGAVLAVRLMLLLAVAGAFFLAWSAMQAPDARGIWILGVYAAMIVGPLVWLSTRRV